MDIRETRGGIAGDIFFALATILAALATYATVAAAVARFDRDPAFAATVLLPAIVTLVFGGALAASIAGRRSKARFDNLKSLHPDEPWRWEPDRWKDGRLRDSARIPLAVTMVVCAAFWNVMAVGVGFTTFERGAWSEKPNVAVVSTLFLLVGLGLIAAAVYFVSAARKFSASTLQMDSVPGVLGGMLSGTVLVPPGVPEGADATITLDCTSFTRGAGRNSNSSRCLWKDEIHGRVSGRSLPVEFSIPFDLDPTDPQEDAGSTTIHWHLRAEAALPGVDYNARFQVPVFRTAASDASYLDRRGREG
jgi:hypothetical protein